MYYYLTSFQTVTGFMRKDDKVSYIVLRPNKKISVFRVTGLKILK